ncbi:MAG TPA: ATP synthase F1 subunit delta [Gemmatimonadaceae bacterium]|nr:ATP synthase F1 subunit delta [Gemmatimonadaceae bacterium]
MREPTIAANYAETLLALAEKAKDRDGWGAMIEDVADAVEQDPTLRLFLDSPRVSTPEKNEILGRAFADRLPRLFVRFLQAVVSRRRQHLIPEIAREYRMLVEAAAGRVHADVSVAREPDQKDRETIARQLARITGKSVVPHYQVRPQLLGGVLVRIGDTVMDGSVARKLAVLRSRMLGRTAG